MHIPASKLIPPSEPAHCLQRPRLLELLAMPGPVRLVVVHAPAGSGKTTLMRHWYTVCRNNRRVVPWLNLDAADNDVERFSQLLLEGFKAASASTDAPPVEESAGVAACHDPIGEALERLPAWRLPFTLFLDEFELIQHESVLHLVRQLIERLPADGEIVIATRVLPEVGLSRLRARGQLRHIDAVDLRFSLVEATEFFRDRQRLPLRDRDIASLTRRTEGWAAALYLSSISLGRRSDHAAFVASFSGSNVAVATYLAQDVFVHQPPDVREFLLCSSVLPRFCGELCDVVMGRSDSARILSELEKDGLFLLALDDSGDWFRYHSLFADFLQRQLDVSHPGRRAGLHRRAARWLHRSGDVVSAIEHLLLAGAHDDAIALISRDGPLLLEQGRIRLMNRWFGQLGPACLQAFPRVYLMYAWTQVLTRRCDAALETVEYVLGASRTDADYAFLALEAGTIRCMALNMSDQMAAATPLCAAMMTSVPEMHVFHHGALATILARGLLAQGRYDDARDVLARAIQRHERVRPSFFRSVVDCIEASIDMTQGRFGNARARLQRALERETGLIDTPRVGGRATIAVRLAVVLYEMDELAAASRIVDESMPYLSEHGTSDSLIFGGLLQARIAAALGDTARARDHLVELEDSGRAMRLPRATQAAWLEQARMATLREDLPAARDALKIAATAGPGETSEEYSLIATQVNDMAVATFRLAIAEGRAEEVVPALRQSLCQAARMSRHWRGLKLRLLLAMALGACGRDGSAMRELTTALQLACRESLYRGFIEEGAGMARLLSVWLRLHPAGRLPPRIDRAFVSALIEKMGGETDAPARPAQAPHLADLTPRESQVLELLANGDETRVIAQRLFVSESTIKTHLRNIYAKLGARRRTQALMIARQYGLVS